MYLYRTQIGVKFIDYVGTRYKKTLRVFSYLAVISGYCLMIAMIYFLYKLVYVYLFNREMVQAIKIPPVMPLVPYVPEMFKIDFLPPFYFTYWIIAIAVIAIFHEFAHGIIARRYDVKVKTTGFGFLGPFLAAFVEPDEKQMVKKSKFQQIAILSAGTFTNLILAVLFFIMLFGFFSLTYAPSGAMFNIYTPEVVNTTDIQMIDGLKVNNLDNKELLNIITANKISNSFVGENGELLNLTEINANGKTYFMEIENLKKQLTSDSNIVYLYQDLPAVRNGLKGTIISVDDKKIRTNEDLGKILSEYSPGDRISVKTKNEKKIYEYIFSLGEDSAKKGRAVIGVGYLGSAKKGLLSKIINLFNFFRKPATAYEPVFNADLVIFIYNLLWWLALINLSVALMNMLPVAIFDGGRMFMLTIWGVSKSQRFGEFAFKAMTYIILGALLLLMVGWALAVF